VITLYTENLIEFYDRLADDQRRSILADIHTETSILYQLIEDLLSLSRLDFWPGRAAPVSVQSGRASRRDSFPARALADDKGVALTFDVPDQHLSIFADRGPDGPGISQPVE